MKTGDRVICIDATSHADTSPPPLVKGREYIVYGVHKCGCGTISFDVGLISIPGSDHMECTDCDRIYNDTGRVHYAKSRRFAKVKEEYRIIHMDIEVEEPILN